VSHAAIAGVEFYPDGVAAKTVGDKRGRAGTSNPVVDTVLANMDRQTEEAKRRRDTARAAEEKSGAEHAAQRQQAEARQQATTRNAAERGPTGTGTQNP
jgi:hypothetical protein